VNHIVHFLLNSPSPRNAHEQRNFLASVRMKTLGTRALRICKTTRTLLQTPHLLQCPSPFLLFPFFLAPPSLIHQILRLEPAMQPLSVTRDLVVSFLFPFFPFTQLPPRLPRHVHLESDPTPCQFHSISVNCQLNIQHSQLLQRPSSTSSLHPITLQDNFFVPLSSRLSPVPTVDQKILRLDKAMIDSFSNCSNILQRSRSYRQFSRLIKSKRHGKEEKRVQ